MLFNLGIASEAELLELQLAVEQRKSTLRTNLQQAQEIHNVHDMGECLKRINCLARLSNRLGVQMIPKGTTV